MRSPQLPALSALAVFLLLIALPTQFRVRNAAVLIDIVSLTLTGISYLVNTLVWAGNVHDVAPVWCDIVTNIWFYGQYVVGCAVLCMAKHLEWITSPRSAMSSRPNRVLFEVVVSVILPLFAIPLRYAVSTNRYMILEDLGCLPALHPSKFAIGLVFGTQLLLTLGICSFGGKAIFNLFRKRYFTKSLVNTSQSAITRFIFLRFLTVCLLITFWGPCLVALTFYYCLSLTFLPWPGWVMVHRHFHQILRLPLILELSALYKAQTFLYWSYIATAHLSAAVLLSCEDVRKDYRRAWMHFRQKLGCHSGDVCGQTSSRASHGSQCTTDSEKALQEIHTIVVKCDQDDV